MRIPAASSSAARRAKTGSWAAGSWEGDSSRARSRRRAAISSWRGAEVGEESLGKVVHGGDGTGWRWPLGRPALRSLTPGSLSTAWRGKRARERPIKDKVRRKSCLSPPLPWRGAGGEASKRRTPRRARGPGALLLLRRHAPSVSSSPRQVSSLSSKIGRLGHAAAGGVDVPAPEEGPLEVGAVRLEHAEDQAVHAVEDAELEDVGAEEAPDGAAEDLGEAGRAASRASAGRRPRSCTSRSAGRTRRANRPCSAPWSCAAPAPGRG